MNIIGKCLKADEFKQYVATKSFGLFPANKIVLHHTYIPNLTQWKGLSTIMSLKKVYEGKGWATGPHLYIAPEGIWLFSDMAKDGTHAGSGNWRSIGIEMVGDYRYNKPKGMVWELTKYAITVLNTKLGLLPEDIKFHRDFMATECPGNAVQKPWVINELLNYNLLPPDKSFVKIPTKKTVYFVRNMVLYPIPDWETFIFYWETPDKIINISEETFNNLTIGKMLPSFKG
jgi:hypothetical protein